MSSNGRTADSGSVNGGSTPSIPAISSVCHMARSSSGSGRRPLKAEITSSNLVRATMSSSGHSEPLYIWPVRLAVQDAALSRRRSPVRIWYGLPTISGAAKAAPVLYSLASGLCECEACTRLRLLANASAQRVRASVPAPECAWVRKSSVLSSTYGEHRFGPSRHRAGLASHSSLGVKGGA